MKFNRVIGISLLGFAAACLTAGAYAQDQQASSADKSFVKTAIKGGNAEIELGQLAQQKGASDDVKQFGKRMMDDHSQLGDQMKTVAGQIGVTPPTIIPPTDKALEMRLKTLSGDDFDKAYIKAMVKDHQQDLSEFRKEAANGNSPAVKDAASQGAKVISEHLAMIQKIAEAHNIQVNTAKNSSSASK